MDEKLARFLGKISGRRLPAATADAVRAERRRIARDLHDGVAQDLAFIAMQARERTSADGSDHLVVAAERALAELRRAIEDLADDSEGSLGDAVSRTAAELTGRSGAQLVANVDPRADAAPEVRNALLRILREAIWNGIRHGGATAVEVELSGGTGLHMRVADNGSGFDVSSARPGGLGLTSIKERVRALGGDVGIRSRPGAGCELEVKLP